jgi:hypothetical protein
MEPPVMVIFSDPELTEDIPWKIVSFPENAVSKIIQKRATL